MNRLIFITLTRNSLCDSYVLERKKYKVRSYSINLGVLHHCIQEFTRRNSPWNQLRELLRQESNELPLKMTIGAATIAYRLAKFVLKP